MKRLLLIPAALLLGGCSINPYASDFLCPPSYRGKCISVAGAYKEAKSGVVNENSDDKKSDSDNKKSGDKKGCESGNCTKDGQPSAEPLTVEARNFNSYKASLYKRFDDLLKEPATPMVAPPKVMRVLLLPYKGQDNEFYAMRHVYFFVDEPRWLLGDSINGLEDD